MKHNHHEEAAKHHEAAAEHHLSAHKANQEGNDELAAHHAHAAHGHRVNAEHEADEAARKHSKNQLEKTKSDKHAVKN
jgi:hypothetical protein